MNVLLFIVARLMFVFALIASCVRGITPQVNASTDDALAHHRVSTRQAAAQREFDNGLTLIYAFNPEEASFHFQQAARIDPHCAMAYWGIALGAGRNINTEYDLQRASIGRQAIALAQQNDSGASGEERSFIEALRLRYSATRNDQVSGAEERYARAMVALARANPNDLDAQTLAAESLMDLTPLHMWLRGGTPNRYTREVLADLEGVLRRNPNHLGATHYIIHAYEDSLTPERALPAARHLAALTLPLGAEHLAHMPAHIFTRVGDWDGAIQANLKAIAMFRAYVPAEHSNIHNAYFHHDYQVLGYAYMMSGQWSKAKDVADQTAIQVDDNGAAVETYLRFHKWRELLALTAPAQTGIRWRYARGMAAVGVGDLNEARITLTSLESLHDRDPRTGIAQATLAASLDTAERHDADAIRRLQSAVSLQDSLVSKEPPGWYYPIRETLGARYLIARDDRSAERVFREDLRRNPNNPRSLFGLSQSLAQRDPRNAAAAATAYKKAWQHADAPLTLSDL